MDSRQIRENWRWSRKTDISSDRPKRLSDLFQYTPIFVCYTIFMTSVLPTVSAEEWSGYVGGELLTFTNPPLDSDQHQHYISAVFQTEFHAEWDNGYQSFTFVPFLRIDSADDRRTHFDLRELTWLKASDRWELRLGVRKVFWGVAESQHLVDIINQTDLVENLDTEDKLGQPMINLAIIQDWGTLDLFLLAGFRERTFAGSEGRLRTIPRVDTNAARFNGNGFKRHFGAAVRWSQAIGDWDIGLSHFYGMSREPLLIPSETPIEDTRLIPNYKRIHQTGLDIQATIGSWLWKLEAIHRSGLGETFNALTGGFEYTFFGAFDTAIDVGVVAEYLFDDRGGDAPVAFQDDFFAGLRFGFNDVQSTEILAGVVFDRKSNSKFYNVEASRRVGDNWKIECEFRVFSGAPKTDITFPLRDDDHVRLEVTYHF